MVFPPERREGIPTMKAVFRIFVLHPILFAQDPVAYLCENIRHSARLVPFACGYWLMWKHPDSVEHFFLTNVSALQFWGHLPKRIIAR